MQSETHQISMIAKEDVLDLLKSTESNRVERITSTGNMDQFCEAICAFANDMPVSRKNGYLIIGAYDNGTIAGMKVDDDLLKKIAGIRSDGNILPLPTMSVERFSYPESDVLVAEVRPSDLPPVRYRGRMFIRIGPRRDILPKRKNEYLLNVVAHSWQPLMPHHILVPNWRIWMLITSRATISRWYLMRRLLRTTSAT